MDMLTALLSLLEGRVGSSIFLFALLLCFMWIYIIMTSDVDGKYRNKRFLTMTAAAIVTDAVWLYYRYSRMIEIWDGTNVDRLFFQFGAGGMIFFAAFVFAGLSEDRPRKALRRYLLGVYMVCLLTSFFSCLAVEYFSDGNSEVNRIVIGVELILNIVMIFIMYVIGFVSVPSENTPHQKKVLAVGLGLILAVMSFIFVYISFRDMNALDFIIKR